MSPMEIGLAGGFVCLAIALTITSVKLAKHEKHFYNIQEILLMAGMSVHELQNEVKKLKEKKESLVND